MSGDKLADVVVRDRFERPVEVLTKDIPDMGAAIAVVLRGVAPKERVIIANPRAWPMNIIGTKPGPICCGCKRETWASPSMQTALAEGLEANVACLECLERAAGMRP